MNHSLGSLSWQEMVVRIGLAFCAGLVIGLERETHGRAAGLRTTILAGTAAALAMILSEYLFVISVPPGGGWRPDPARLGAGILTGIGFLGAGTIIRQENFVRGVTTAATLWSTTVLGLAFGAGYAQVGLIGTGFVCVALFVLPFVEQRIRKDWYAVVVLRLKLSGPTEGELSQYLEAFGIAVRDMHIEYDLAGEQRSIRYAVRFKRSGLTDLSQQVVRKLAALPEVLQVNWS